MASTTLLDSRIVRVTLPEQKRLGKPLGRHIHHDSRSRNYPAARASEVTSVYHSGTGLPLRQDDSHSCSTAHSLCGAINSSPNNRWLRRELTEQDALRIYQTSKILEPDEGSVGSSGLMACKAALTLELITSYRHAFGLRHALEALVLRPVITGLNWYTSFDSPDPRTGIVTIAPDATVRGGHEVIAHAIDTDANLVWFWNSWGPDYGIGGRFCMTFDTWDRLLREQGDVTVPIT